MNAFPRITHNPAVMGGKPCIRGMRVTAGMVVAALSTGQTASQVLADYPYLEAEDISQSLAYAAWRLEEQEFDLKAA